MRFTNEEHTMAASGGFALGLIWGAAIGAAVAFLVAPRSGAELRGQIADSVNRLGQRARDSYDRTSERMNHLAARATELADDVAGRAAELTAKMHRTEWTSPSRMS